GGEAERRHARVRCSIRCNRHRCGPHDLLPKLAYAAVRHLVDVDVAVIVKAEQGRLRIVPKPAEYSVERRQCLHQAIATGGAGMPKPSGDAKRVPLWLSWLDRWPPRQLEEQVGNHEVATVCFENWQPLVGGAGRRRGGEQLCVGSGAG